jgi:hypothetical protein
MMVFELDAGKLNFGLFLTVFRVQITPEPCFVLPDNWQTISFFVESNKAPLKAVTLADQGNIRYELTNFLVSQAPLPIAKSFLQWMFVLIDGMMKSTVICVHPRFFVTFRHGTHGRFQIGEQLQIHKANEAARQDNAIHVSVAQVHEEFDLILLKSPIGVNIVEVRS